MEADHQSQSRAQRRIPVRVPTALSIVLALAAGLGLRLWMLKQFFEVNGDSLIYGELGKNLLLHGSYAFAGAGGAMHPTLIRLPGYPLFLALCFRLFGMENYASAAWVQIALDLAGCLLLADFARRIAPTSLKTGAPGDGSLSLGWSNLGVKPLTKEGRPHGRPSLRFGKTFAAFAMKFFQSIRPPAGFPAASIPTGACNGYCRTEFRLANQRRRVRRQLDRRLDRQ